MRAAPDVYEFQTFTNITARSLRDSLLPDEIGDLPAIDHKEGPVEDVARVVKETGMTKMVVIEGPRERLLRFAEILPGTDTMPHVTSVEDIREACTALRTTVIRLSLEQLAKPEAVASVHGCGRADLGDDSWQGR